MNAYRCAHFLTLRPPLANGGHAFVACHDPGAEPQLWRCIGCHGYVPGWALTEGFARSLLGTWCRGMFAALPSTTLAAAHHEQLTLDGVT